MVHDELDGVVSALCARFPNRARNDIEKVVAAQYAEQAANATVTAHLIPLTLNRSRRLLAHGAAVTADEVGVRPANANSRLATIRGD
ncbi:MAG: three-helix bundle dimerization domain-containing protein [Mycobacterium sp.]